MRPCPRTCRLVIGLRALSLQTKVVHQHPFGRHQETHQIDGTLEPGSVFTWPFRLSMAQSQATIKRQGRYFGDLEPRLDRYCKRLSPAASLVFLSQLRQPGIGRQVQIRARGLRASQEPGPHRPFSLREERSGSPPQPGQADIISPERGVEANGAGLTQRPLRSCVIGRISKHSEMPRC